MQGDGATPRGVPPPPRAPTATATVVDAAAVAALTRGHFCCGGRRMDGWLWTVEAGRGGALCWRARR